MDFKKILLILCLFVGLNTFAQNRLEFNQVINISSNTTNYSLDTVPQKKVWKITGIAASNSNPYARPIINNNDIGQEYITYPYWLKEGSIIGAFINSNYFNTLEFSIIEFNIIID